MPRRKPKYPKARVQRSRPPQNPANYMMKGMMDMTTLAVGGAVGIGMIGAAGALIPKG